MELYIGGSVYTGKATVCRRKFPEFPYDLVVMIASCRFVMDFNDPESKPNGFPDKFTQVKKLQTNITIEAASLASTPSLPFKGSASLCLNMMSSELYM